MSKAKKFVKEVTSGPDKPKMKSISVRVSAEVWEKHEALKKLIKENSSRIDADLNGWFADSIEKDIKSADEAVKLKLEQFSSTTEKMF